MNFFGSCGGEGAEGSIYIFEKPVGQWKKPTFSKMKNIPGLKLQSLNAWPIHDVISCHSLCWGFVEEEVSADATTDSSVTPRKMNLP